LPFVSKLFPNVEREVATGPKYTQRFSKPLPLIGEEHHTKLTHHHIELTIGKRQVNGVGLLPADALAADIA
jgi:hypothetical protein